MKHEPAISPRPRRQPTLDDFRRAKAAQAVGGDIDHVVVSQWLLTLGDSDYTDFDEWLQKQDG